MSLHRVFAGGDRCFVTLQSSRGPGYDSRSHPPNTQILFIDQNKLEPCLALAEDEQVDQVMTNNHIVGQYRLFAGGDRCFVTLQGPRGLVKKFKAKSMIIINV